MSFCIPIINYEELRKEQHRRRENPLKGSYPTKWFTFQTLDGKLRVDFKEDSKELLEESRVGTKSIFYKGYEWFLLREYWKH